MALKTYLEKYAAGGPYATQPPKQAPGMVVCALLRDERGVEAFVAMVQAAAPQDTYTELLLMPYFEGTRIPGPQEVPGFEFDLDSWNSAHFAVHLLPFVAVPHRKYGLGMARKMVMDEALHRFERAGLEDGLMVCVDSDARFDLHYLRSIYHQFKTQQSTRLALMGFAMPAHNLLQDSGPERTATSHELHWRYYNQGLRACGFHAAHHTLGTAMAMRCSAYQQMGGMYPGKLDADFHFLRKMTEALGYHEMHEALVYPGPSAYAAHENPASELPGSKTFYSFHPQAFRYLQTFFKQLPEFYLKPPVLEQLGADLPYILIDFLGAYFFDERMAEIRNNSKSYNSFERRFFLWFNSAMALRFVQFVRDNAHPNMRVEHAALELLRSCGHPGVDAIRSFDELLHTYRAIEALPRRLQLRLS